MVKQSQSYILLFQCKDRRGIVACISDFIFRNGGNIITADQYSSDPNDGHFFMRVEFVIEGRNCDTGSLVKGLRQAAARFSASYRLYNRNETLRMGILASRPGHCLNDLLYLWKSGELRVKVPLVISNHEPHRELAAQYRVPFYFIPSRKSDRCEDEILSLVNESTDFLILARYMLVFSRKFLRGYGKDIINIHHGLLPSFKGADPYRQALDKGVKVIGATSHFVNEKLDSGPIISQEVEEVSHEDNVESLRQKGKDLEKKALAHAVFSYVKHRIIRHGNKTIVF